MQVKKKYNQGGIQSWPPDTEVMASDNTYVTPPQLNFLANQLLPIEVPTNSQAELLRHLHGFTNVVSTEKPRPSLEYITQKRIFNEVFRDSQQRTQALIDQGLQRRRRLSTLLHTMQIRLTANLMRSDLSHLSWSF